MIHTIIVKKEEILANRQKYKDNVQEKINKWIEEEFDEGWIIEILKIDYRYQPEDNNHYWDIEYRKKRDPIHLQLLERLKVGL